MFRVLILTCTTFCCYIVRSTSSPTLLSTSNPTVPTVTPTINGSSNATTTGRNVNVPGNTNSGIVFLGGSTIKSASCYNTVQNIRSAYYANSGEFMCRDASFNKANIQCVETSNNMEFLIGVFNFPTQTVPQTSPSVPSPTADNVFSAACVDFSTGDFVCYDPYMFGIQIGLGLLWSDAKHVVCPQSLKTMDWTKQAVCAPQLNILWSFWPEYCTRKLLVPSTSGQSGEQVGIYDIAADDGFMYSMWKLGFKISLSIFTWTQGTFVVTERGRLLLGSDGVSASSLLPGTVYSFEILYICIWILSFLIICAFCWFAFGDPALDELLERNHVGYEDGKEEETAQKVLSMAQFLKVNEITALLREHGDYVNAKASFRVGAPVQSVVAFLYEEKQFKAIEFLCEHATMIDLSSFTANSGDLLNVAAENNMPYLVSRMINSSMIDDVGALVEAKEYAISKGNGTDSGVYKVLFSAQKTVERLNLLLGFSLFLAPVAFVTGMAITIAYTRIGSLVDTLNLAMLTVSSATTSFIFFIRYFGHARFKDITASFRAIASGQTVQLTKLDPKALTTAFMGSAYLKDMEDARLAELSELDNRNIDQSLGQPLVNNDKDKFKVLKVLKMYTPSFFPAFRGFSLSKLLKKVSPRIILYREFTGDIFLSVVVSLSLAIPILFPWPVVFPPDGFSAIDLKFTIIVCAVSTVWSGALIFSEALIFLMIQRVLGPCKESLLITPDGMPWISLDSMAPKDVSTKYVPVPKEDKDIDFEKLLVALRKLREIPKFLELQFYVFLVEMSFTLASVLYLLLHGYYINLLTIALSTIGGMPLILCIVNMLSFNNLMREIEVAKSIKLRGKVTLFFGRYEPDWTIIFVALPPVTIYVLKNFFGIDITA